MSLLIRNTKNITQLVYMREDSTVQEIQNEIFRNTTINGLSIRAIVLNNGPASYQRTKYLDHLLSALRQRQFTVKSTKHFRSKVKQMELRKSYRMISFDEKPLFTYLPLSYTFDKEIETSLT